MKGKRSLKKQQKRAESVLERLEELYRRGADDELLARAAEQAPEIAASAFAPKWAEAADRALRQSLARADLDRLERLLPALRRSGPLRPLARLIPWGETVLDLAAGRREAARARLTALACLEGEAGALPPSLSVSLQALAEEKTDGDSGFQAARNFIRALQSLEKRGFEPTTLDRRSLAGKLAAARQAAATVAATKTAETSRLFDDAGRCLSLLDDLISLENRLAQLPEGQLIAQVTAWLRGSGRLLEQALTPSGPALLAPLRHTVHMRWRAVLERVKEHAGSPCLASLCAAHPDLLAHDVDLPGGIQGSLAKLRQREQARRLLADRNFKDLADLLRARGRSTSESGELAVLWSLELWACGRSPADEDGGEDGEDDLFDELTGEPPGHRALVRLEEMAREINRRFAAGQRAEVAQALRAKLFDLSEQTYLCDHAAGAALLLLEHQPGDVGLLIVGVAGAVAGELPQTLRSLEARISQAGKAQPADRATVERLMAQVAHEAPRDVARALTMLRPLFTDEAWPEVAALVAQEATWMTSRPLLDACMERIQGLAAPSPALAAARADLTLLRPLLGGTSGFSAMELALDCWSPDRRAVERRLAEFLAADPRIESALTALQLLETVWGPWTPSGAEAAYPGLARAVIDVIGRRSQGGRGEIGWQLWYHAAPLLAFFADSSDRQRLDKEIRRLLSSPRLPEDDREKLDRALQAVQSIAAKTAERRSRPPRAQRKKSRRGRAGSPQLLLDLP